jgi:hypothetical protein
MLAPFGIVASGEPEVDQGIQVGVGHREDVTAAATIATIGATELFVFFVAK